jgi:hypothetical protein
MKSTNTKRIGVNKWGSTWAGATRPCGLPRRLTPRSSLPPTYYQRPTRVPELDPYKYLVQSKAGT